MASRAPVSTGPRTAGTITRRSSSKRVALSDAPSCSQRGSIARTPALVLSRIGHTALNANRNQIGASPTPSSITAMGIHDSGEIIRSN